MGCIGYPGHPVWEVTAACNLKCIHCHAERQPGAGELTTDEGKRLIDEIAAVRDFRTLVFSGGEPLVRKDIYTLLRHAQKAGLANIIATNGTLIDEETAFKLKDHGVVCHAISMDSYDPKTHNLIRNSPEAYDLALRAMEATRRAGILLQINTTAMEYNLPHLGDLIDFVEGQKAGIMLMYQLVAVGRGEKIRDKTLKKEANRDLCDLIAAKQRDVATVVEPVAGPQYWPYLLERKGLTDGPAVALARQVFHGCAAGRGFVYIKATGDVWPCPFVEVTAGNVKERAFGAIYRESEVFKALRNREETLKGACGDCRWRGICGGCRGRAMAFSGDYLAEDPRCFLRTTVGPKAGYEV